MSLQDFYAEQHLDVADGFGSMAGGRKNPHRGLDVNGISRGTEVPNLYAGVVARSEYQGGLGNVVCVAADAGFYVGYSHLDVRDVVEGQRVEVGQIVGTLGNTGSLSFGAHTHVTVSFTSDDPSTGPTVDPLPYIRAARDGGSTPSAGGSTGGEYSFGLTADAQLAAQKALTAFGYYSGDVDGVFGPLSVTAFQQWLKDNGYLSADYDVDGVPGPVYGEAVQRLADRFGYTAKGGTFDGYPGAITSECIVEWGNSVTVPVSQPSVVEQSTPVVEPVPVAVVEPVPVPSVPDRVESSSVAAHVKHEIKVEEPVTEEQLERQESLVAGIQPVDLGAIITNGFARKIVWAVYGLTGLAIIALMGGLTAARWLAPEWFIFATGAYTAIGPAFASLAIANIKK